MGGSPEAGGRLVVLEGGPQPLEAEEVGIETAAAYLVATGTGNKAPAVAGKKGPEYHDGTAEAGCLAAEVVGVEVGKVDVDGPEGVFSLIEAVNHDPHTLKEVDEFDDIKYLGDIGDDDFLVGEKGGTDDLQCLVFSALRVEFSF